MQIHTFPSTTVQHNSALFIAEYLAKELAEGPIFLLLSGGSAIGMYQEMFQLLIDQSKDLHNLTVSLFDERFVLKGSSDSNEQQLKQNGTLELIEKHSIRWLPYLNSVNRTGLEVAHTVSQVFEKELSSGKKLIILAGIGDDCHTAGLLPTKDALTIQSIFESPRFVEYYELADDVINHFRQRITATPALIKEADQVIVYTTGEKKRQAVERFSKKADQIPECPSIALNNSKKPVIVFTDLDL